MTSKYIFKKIKYADTNTINEQLAHILEEIVEIMRTENVEDLREEITDLRQSVETLVRIAEREGMDVEAETFLVEHKNEIRGYHQLNMHCFGKFDILDKTCEECGNRECRDFTRGKV